MKPLLLWSLIAVLIGAAAVGGWAVGRRTASAADPDEGGAATPAIKPTLPVRTVPIVQSEIVETLTAYGVVTSQAADVSVLSVPYESRVVRMLVNPGQEVPAGAVILEVVPSTASQLAIEEIRNAVDAAQRSFDQVQQRYNEKLATNQELLTAQNDLRSTKAKLQNLEQGGAAGGNQAIKAVSPGLVSKIDVQLGQVVPAAGPLVELAATKHIEVKIGIEPEDISYLSVDQPVELRKPDHSVQETITGHLRLLSQRINPDTKLVDVFVTLPENVHLLLDGFIVAQLTKRSSNGLVVPRAAVLPTDEGNILYTVEGGKAERHQVEIGVENETNLEIRGAGLKTGDPAVVEGNYELDDGMLVTAAGAAATTEPTTAPSTEGAP